MMWHLLGSRPVYFSLVLLRHFYKSKSFCSDLIHALVVLLLSSMIYIKESAISEFLKDHELSNRVLDRS